MIRQRFICFFLMLLPLLTRAQTPAFAPDSLLKILKSDRRDTNYVKAANTYAWLLIDSLYLPKADSVLAKAEITAKKLNNNYWVLKLYFTYAQLNISKLNLPEALKYAQKAHNLAKKSNSPPYMCMMALTLLGNVSFSHSQFEAALNYYLKAIALIEKYNLKENSATPYQGIAMIMSEMGQRKEATRYARLAFAQAAKDPNATAKIAPASNLAKMLLDEGNTSEAIKYLTNVTGLFDNYDNITQKITIWGYLCNAYMILKQPAPAKKYLELIKSNINESGSREHRMSAYLAISSYYEKLGENHLAIKYGLKAYRIMDKKSSFEFRRYIVGRLSVIYALTRQYKIAYDYEYLYGQLNDSLFSNQLAIKTRELVTKFESKTKEDQILNLKKDKENQRLQRNLIIIGAVLAFLLIIVIAAWLLNRTKLRQLKQTQTLREQIANDLHDEVGSTLSSISLLSGMAEKLLAEKKIISLSDPTYDAAIDVNNPVQNIIKKIYSDTRQILESVDEIVWTVNPTDNSINQLILRIREFAIPLFESKSINYTIDCDESLDMLKLDMNQQRHMYLICKEAINNLVKHADATKAEIAFRYINRQIKILIKDDGKGFDTNSQFSRNGQKTMKRRAFILGSEILISSSRQHGTSVELNIPR